MALSLFTPSGVVTSHFSCTAQIDYSQPFNWRLDAIELSSGPTDIKVEPDIVPPSVDPVDPAFSLLSPPSSPGHRHLHAASHPPHTTSPDRTFSNGHLSQRERPSHRHRPAGLRRSAHSSRERDTMSSQQHAYGTWGSPSPASIHPAYPNRRSLDTDMEDPAYLFSGEFATPPVMSRRGRIASSRADVRVGSSSLSGAIGPTGHPQVPHTSGPPSSPSPTSDVSSFQGHETMQWVESPQMGTSAAPSALQLQSLPSGLASTTGGFVSFPDYSGSSYIATPPNSHSPNGPIFPNDVSYSTSDNPRLQAGFYPSNMPSRSHTVPYSGVSRSADVSPSPAHLSHSSSYAMSSPELMAQEIAMLRQKIRELEAAASYAQVDRRTGPSCSAPPSSLPSPLPSPIPSSGFRHSWQQRTDARRKLFCSPNRAGNALCAWHDSRRERRTYPARMAPEGYLNCGCSVEETLFEESLSRHGVGSYRPGEAVRMDPALRNPLLKLLQERYGYQDGDFERHPSTGMWVDGEGSEVWEARLQASLSNPRARRNESTI